MGLVQTPAGREQGLVWDALRPHGPPPPVKLQDMLSSKSHLWILTQRERSLGGRGKVQVVARWSAGFKKASYNRTAIKFKGAKKGNARCRHFKIALNLCQKRPSTGDGSSGQGHNENGGKICSMQNVFSKWVFVDKLWSEMKLQFILILERSLIFFDARFPKCII